MLWRPPRELKRNYLHRIMGCRGAARCVAHAKLWPIHKAMKEDQERLLSSADMAMEGNCVRGGFRDNLHPLKRARAGRE